VTIFLGKEISSHWINLLVANMCQNWTSVGKRSATMRSWSDITSGSRQTILAAYPRRYKKITKILILCIFIKINIFSHNKCSLLSDMYTYGNSVSADSTRHTYNIFDYSGRLGGKPFLELAGSLSVPNIGEKA